MADEDSLLSKLTEKFTPPFEEVLQLLADRCEITQNDNGVVARNNKVVRAKVGSTFTPNELQDIQRLTGAQLSFIGHGGARGQEGRNANECTQAVVLVGAHGAIGAAAYKRQSEHPASRARLQSGKDMSGAFVSTETQLCSRITWGHVAAANNHTLQDVSIKVVDAAMIDRHPIYNMKERSSFVGEVLLTWEPGALSAITFGAATQATPQRRKRDRAT